MFITACNIGPSEKAICGVHRDSVWSALYLCTVYTATGLETDIVQGSGKHSEHTLKYYDKIYFKINFYNDFKILKLKLNFIIFNFAVVNIAGFCEVRTCCNVLDFVFATFLKAHWNWLICGL
jgi:hypothetical protein